MKPRAINHRLRIALPLLMLAALAALAWHGGWFDRQPNVLLITLDTTRPDHLGCYGDAAAETPALDRLAAEGVLFERAYSPAPLTLPAHASLLTGLYPPEHGLRTNGRGSLGGDVPTLAALLQKEGYETGAFVASFVLHAKFGLDRGFSKYDDDLSRGDATADSLQRQRDGGTVVDAALGWLRQPRRQPFFCWVHLYDPHAPYQSHEAEFGDRFKDRPYDGEIAYADRQVQRLLDFLEQSGRANDTLVIVAGDHGEGLGDHVERQHGFTLYDSTQRVPLIWRRPGTLPAGERVAAPVSLVDVFPTVLELVGLSPPAPVSGRSLRAAWDGGEFPARATYAATDDPYLQNAWSALRSYTTDRWRYIRTSQSELYDLLADPGETRNLIASQPEVARDLERQLAEWESRMTARRADSVHLSAEERRRLKSLGYLGGTGTEPQAVADPAASDLPDVKEMLPFDVETQAALDLLRSGHAEDAARKLEELTRKARHHVASRVFLGEAYEAQGRLDLAAAAYENALDVKPDHVDAWIHLANVAVAQGRLPDAQRHFTRAIELDPDSAEAHYNLGLVHFRQSRLAEAYSEFQEALQADPLLLNVNAALGNLHATNGQLHVAITDYEAELELNPRSAESHANLGAILARNDRPREAFEHLERAIELAPRSALAHYQLGLLHAGRKEYDRAETELRKALEIDPQNARAQEELDRVLRLRK